MYPHQQHLPQQQGQHQQMPPQMPGPSGLVQMPPGASQQQLPPNHPMSQQMQQSGAPVMYPNTPALQPHPLWQNQGHGGYYDSGIQSSTTTATQSVMSGRSSLDNHLLMDNMSTMSADFADFNAQQMQYPQLQGLPNLQPGKHAHSQETLHRAIPTLVTLLQDDDVVVLRNAALTAKQMTKQSAAVLYVLERVEQPNLVSAIANLLRRTDDGDTQKHAVSALHNLTQFTEGPELLAMNNAIQPLVDCLSSDRVKILYLSIVALHNLVSQAKPIANLPQVRWTKQHVRQVGGVNALVNTIRSGCQTGQDEKFLAIVLDCLLSLMSDDTKEGLQTKQCKEAKQQVLNSGGTQKLVEMMGMFQYEKLLYMNAKLLKVLSADEPNKQFIISIINDAMKALIPLVDHASSRVITQVLLTIRNLSDLLAANQVVDLRELLRRIIALLGSDDYETVKFSADILMNLTANNEKNKNCVFELSGVDSMVRVVRFWCRPSYDAANKARTPQWDIVESALIVLRHLMNKHCNVAQAQQQFVCTYGGLALLLETGVEAVNTIDTQTHGDPMHRRQLSEWKARVQAWKVTLQVIKAILNSQQTHMIQLMSDQCTDMLQVLRVCVTVQQVLCRDQTLLDQLRCALLSDARQPIIYVQLCGFNYMDEVGADAVRQSAVSVVHCLAQYAPAIDLFTEHNTNHLQHLLQSININVTPQHTTFRDRLMGCLQALSASREQQYMMNIAPAIGMFDQSADTTNTAHGASDCTSSLYDTEQYSSLDNTFTGNMAMDPMSPVYMDQMPLDSPNGMPHQPPGTPNWGNDAMM